jgi:hypothetical protein
LTRHLVYHCLHNKKQTDRWDGSHPAKQRIEFASRKPWDHRQAQDHMWLAWFESRWVQWEIAFRSLYTQVQSGCLDYFYVCFPKYSILFATGGSLQEDDIDSAKRTKSTSNASSPSIIGVMSTTTSVLRRQMDRFGVKYTMPFRTAEASDESSDPVADVKGVDSDADPDADMVYGNGPKPQDLEGTRESTVVVNGETNVHCLYDFVLNSSSRVAQDVPTLVAPGPFMNGIVRSATITNVTNVVRASSAKANAARGVRQVLYGMEINGPVLPTALPILFNIIRSAADVSDSVADANTDNKDDTPFELDFRAFPIEATSNLCSVAQLIHRATHLYADGKTTRVRRSISKIKWITPTASGSDKTSDSGSIRLFM